MKRLLAILLLLCLVPGVCLAVPVGTSVYDAPEMRLPFELLDSSPSAGGIMRVTAPNGQALHFVSWLTTPVVHSLDVNFDGVEDLAVMVSSGASNSVFRLFIRQEKGYVAVDDRQEEGLFNFALYPQLGLVASQGTSGLAGALHETTLLRWEGHRLVPLRSALCESLKTYADHDDAYTTTTWNNILHARVFAYDQNGINPVLLFEETYDMDAQGMEDAYLAFFQREQDALWQGIGE